MKNPTILISAVGLGAGLMYFLDPNRGKRRRAMVKDRAVHLSKAARLKINRKGVDVRNRAQGVWFETEKLFEDDTVTNEQLEGRIRARLGRLSAHPHALETSVEDGKVTLSGAILADEVETVLKGVAAVRGVRELENNLEVHETAENVSSLAGNNRASAVGNHKTDWSPKMRVLGAAAGGGLTLLGFAKRNAVNSLLSSVGVGLITRSVTNKPLRKLLWAKSEQLIEVQKTITIDAPTEKVFEVLKYPQYFPYFMTHVRKVERTGDKEFLWTVDGVAGAPVEWAIKITEVVPNKLIRWKNVDGQQNVHAGEGALRLEKLGDASTRLHLELKFPPIIGKLENFAAGLFRRDPKSRLDDDVLRLKTYLEKGKLPHDAAINKKSKRRNEMKVQEIMSKVLGVATLNTSLHEAAQMMADFDCGCLPVIENEENKKPIGMLTDRDITLRTVAHNKNPLNMNAGEVMTDNVVTVTPDTSVEDCIATMERNQIRRVAVVDGEGNLCGMVAQADIARKAPAFEAAELLKDVSAAA